MKFDVFISHASEDKADVARPLAQKLRDEGISVWLDENELTLGDSLRRKIDLGLTQSRYGLVILSRAFFGKEWPNKELDGLVAREDGREKVILPVWHNVSRREVATHSPPLADKLAVSTADGLGHVVLKVKEALARSPASLRVVASDPQSAGASDSSIDTNNVEASQTSPFSMDSLVVELLDRVVERHENGADFVTGIRTGFTQLDQLTAGLQAGDLVVVASRPSVGKTALALNIAEHVATSEGLPVLIFSLEMRARDLTQRLAASMARIDHFHLRIGALRDDEWERFSEAAEKLGKSQIFVDETPEVSSKRICEIAKKQAATSGALGLIVVDYLQLMRGVRGASDSSTFDALRDLKRLARDIGCPVVLISMVNRSVETRPDKRPMLSDFTNSEAIHQHVDLVLFVYRDEHYTGESSNAPGIAEIIVAKQRRGPVGTILLSFLRPFARFDNVTSPEGSTELAPFPAPDASSPI